MFPPLFQPHKGAAWFGYAAASLFACFLLLAFLHALPPRIRPLLIRGFTFLAGLAFALEFFWPTHHSGPLKGQNFLTPYIVPFGNITPVIAGFTVGMGVVNLFQIHLKRLTRRNSESLFSFAFFASFFAILIVNLLAHAHPNSINKNLNKLLFNGGLQALDSTMFSIIAFFIVSAAYRAFRIRSVEATLLLATALIVMLGQIPIGTALTASLPQPLHLEVWRSWILSIANVAAIRAIAFGLGIGGLAMALRVWLGLERGAYFDQAEE